MLIRLLQRELCLCFRHRTSLFNAMLFMVVIACLFPLATTPDRKVLEIIGPGVIWMSALLAMLLSSYHLFKEDYLDGSLDQMMMSDSLSHYVFAKVFANWMLLALPLILITPLLSVLYHLNGRTIELLILGLLLGTPTLSFIAAMMAALTLGLKQGGLLLLLMALPLYVPIVIFATTAVMLSAQAFPVAQYAFLAAMMALVIFVFPVATSAVLRMWTLAVDD